MHSIRKLSFSELFDIGNLLPVCSRIVIYDPTDDNGEFFLFTKLLHKLLPEYTDARVEYSDLSILSEQSGGLFNLDRVKYFISAGEVAPTPLCEFNNTTDDIFIVLDTVEDALEAMPFMEAHNSVSYTYSSATLRQDLSDILCFLFGVSFAPCLRQYFNQDHRYSASVAYNNVFLMVSSQGDVPIFTLEHYTEATHGFDNSAEDSFIKNFIMRNFAVVAELLPNFLGSMEDIYKIITYMSKFHDRVLVVNMFPHLSSADLSHKIYGRCSFVEMDYIRMHAQFWPTSDLKSLNHFLYEFDQKVHRDDLDINIARQLLRQYIYKFGLQVGK